MKLRSQELGIDDRISTREELGEVIGLLIKLHQLPFEAVLDSVESSESGSHAEDLELWTDAERGRRPGAEIEPLTDIILGRTHRLN
jgi:hypothetical protein